MYKVGINPSESLLFSSLWIPHDVSINIILFLSKGRLTLGSLQQYADDWESSSKFHYDNGDYEWMESIIHSYKRVLEIGCGTGYSSKTLLSHGHEVLAVDNNQFCIEKAQLLLNDYPHFSILKGDIIESAFCDLLRKNKFDIVVCWNVGGEYSDEEAKKYYAKMVPY